MEWQDGRLEWAWDGRPVPVAWTVRGDGPTVLLLPTLSSISTRREMRPLQERLGASFRTVAVDWPGFGELPRPKLAWRPQALRAFLEHAARAIAKPAATVAAGHAAGYALAQAADAPGSLGPLSLVAPTWRGPLPTVAGRRMALFRRLTQAADLPALGALLYRININRPMIRMMARGHVYEDADWLTPRRLSGKLAVTEATGARHASLRFRRRGGPVSRAQRLPRRRCARADAGAGRSSRPCAAEVEGRDGGARRLTGIEGRSRCRSASSPSMRSTRMR